MSLPSPRAHHSLLWKPLPANRHANRTGGCDDAFFATSSPQTGTDSSHGSAIVTPTPCRNARRENGWVTRFAIVSLRSRRLVGVVAPPDHLKLPAADNHLHRRRDVPLVLIQFRHHLVDQRLVGKDDRPTQRVPQQPPAEQPDDHVPLPREQVVSQPVDAVEFGPVLQL